jgi:hypothetical protein
MIICPELMMNLSPEKVPCTELRALGLNQVKQVDQFQMRFFPRFSDDDSTNQRITYPTSCSRWALNPRGPMKMLVRNLLVEDGQYPSALVENHR